MNNKRPIFSKNFKNKNSINDVDIDDCTITNSNIINCNVNQLTTDNIVVLNETVGNIFLNEKMTLYAGDSTRTWSIRNTSANNILNFKYHNGAGIYFDNLNIHPNHKAEFIYQVHTPTLSTGNLQFTNYRDTWFKYENSKFDFNPYIILSNNPLKSYEGSTLYTALDYLGFNSSSSMTLIDTAIETITGVDPNLNSWDDIERLNIMTLQYNSSHFEIQSSGLFPFTQNKLALKNLNNSKRILYADSGNIGNSASLQYDFFSNSMTAGSKLFSNRITSDELITDKITIGENDIGLVYSNFKDTLMTNGTITYSTISNMKSLNILNTNFTSSNITTTDLTATNIKVNNLSVGNVVLTNISAGNITTTDLTVSNAKITGLSVGNLITTNISAGNIFSTDITTNNLKATLISAGTLNLTEITTSTLYTGTLNVVDQATIPTLLSTNASISNLNCSSITFGSLNLDDTLELSSGQLKGNYTGNNKISISGRNISVDPTWTSEMDSVKLTWDARLAFLNTSPIPNFAFVGASQYDIFVIAALATNTAAAATALGVGSDALVKINNLYDTGNITYIQPTFANIIESCTIPSLLCTNISSGSINTVIQNIPSQGYLELGYGKSGKASNAGQIRYGTFSDGIDIIGGGDSAGSRLTTFYDNVNIIDELSCSNISTNNASISNLLVSNLSASNIFTNNATFSSVLISTGNLNIYGEISASNLKSTNLTSSNILSNNITTSNLISDIVIGNSHIYTSNLDVTNLITASNVCSLNSTFSNSLITNLTASNIFTNNATFSSVLISTGNLNIYGEISASNLKSTNLTTGNILSNNITSGTITSDVVIGNSHIYTGNIDITNLITSSNLCSLNSTFSNSLITNATISNLSFNSTNLSSSNIYSANATISNLLISSGNLNVYGQISCNNIKNVNLTSGNILSTNITTSSLISDIVIGNSHIYTTNIDVTNLITCSNLCSLNSTFSNSLITNLSTSNLSFNNATCNNLKSTNSTFSNSVITNLSTGSINLNEITVKKITTNFLNLENFPPDNFTMATTANLAAFSFFSGDTSASIYNFGTLDLVGARYGFIKIHTPCKFKIGFTYNFTSDG